MEAVQNQFRSTGYAATSLDDLMTVTGLGKGSLYGAFGDKHQLFLRVLDDYCSYALEATQEALEGDAAGAYERLRRYVFGTVEGIARDVTHRGCLLARATAELAGSDPVVRERALQTHTAVEDKIVICIEQAQRHGDIDASHDARQAGSLLYAVLRGLEALGKAGKDEVYLRRIAEAALATL